MKNTVKKALTASAFLLLAITLSSCGGGQPPLEAYSQFIPEQGASAMTLEEKKTAMAEAVEEYPAQIFSEKEVKSANLQFNNLLDGGVISGIADLASDNYKVSGQAGIVSKNDVSYLVLESSFSIEALPAVHVYLSTEAGVNGTSVDLGLLQSIKENQSFEISTDVDTSGFTHIVLYSVPFMEVVGGGKVRKL
ncbi:MAG: DM13 domain-containing protein [Patescibacteria group bacterium]